MGFCHMEPARQWDTWFSGPLFHGSDREFCLIFSFFEGIPLNTVLII
jgi:hypothetical protein